MKILGLLLLAALVRSDLPNLCGNDVCHRYASCVGGRCNCNQGYTGDGKTCIGIGVCGTQGNDCHSDATCTDTGPGTYQCTCNEGFDGNGKSCSASKQSAAQCKKMDIIFVLDRSSSIRTTDFNLMRTFLLSLGEKLKIGKRDAEGEIIGQGAIVTFSEQGTTRITLKQSQTDGRFARVVKNMPGPLPGGRTKTHRGLALADKNVVIKSAGYRADDPEVERIFMVITDGKQTRESPRKGYKYVRKAMQPFFERDMDVFAVGVGLTDSSAQQQIRDMVEDPENAILAQNFMELTETVNNFIQKFCKVPARCGNTDDCSPQASCEDTGAGEYQCTCQDGYVGNGKFCLVPPVCGSDRDDCDPFFATCTDKSSGEYECKCIPGYTGDGKTCIANKVCGTPKDDCHQYATCTDLEPGEYECKCNLGYSGDGKTCIAISIGFESVTYDVKEEDRRAIIGISVKTGEITTPLTFNLNTVYGTAGEADFTGKSQSITIQPGQSGPIQVQIDIEDDTQIEPTEAFQVALSDPSYSVQIGNPATVNILDNDEAVIGFTSRVVDVREDQTAVMEIGFESGSASSPVTVSLATNAGTASDGDFVGRTVDVRFEAGETGPKRVQFEIVDDTMVENTEAFTVSMVSSSLSAVKLGEPSTVNILDNDQATIGFSKALYETAENVGKARVWVGFVSGEAVIPVTVGFATSTGAAGEEDFVSKTMDVTFQPGEKEKWIEIDIIDDDLFEPTESFGLSLVSSSVESVKLGEPSSMNIIDNDEVTIGFEKAVYEINEDAGKARVWVSFLSGEAVVPVTVGFTTSTGTAGDADFVSKTTDVTFQPGEERKWIDIDIIDDDLLEPTESFGLSLVSSSVEDVKLGKPSSVNIIDNDDATIGFVSQAYDVPEDGKARIAIGFLEGQATSPVTVRLSTSPATASSEDFVAREVDVTFEPGETGPKVVEFDLVDDLLVEATESFNVTLVSSSNPAVQLGRPSVVNILDNDEAVIGFESSVYEVNEDGKAVVKIGFASGEASVPVTVQLATSPGTAIDEDFVSRTVDVTFEPGETGPKEVEFEIVDDLLVEDTESFQVSIVSSSVPAVKSGGPATVNIIDNDEAIVRFIEGSYDVAEDESAVIEVAISSGTLTSPVTIRLETEPLTAGHEDYVPKTVDITFQAGETGPKTMTIPIIDDLMVEPTERFKVNLVSSSDPSVKLGEPTAVNILLKDNDDAVIGFSKSAFNVPESENARIGVGFASGTSSVPVTITLETIPSTASENNDYVPQRVNVTLQPGETIKTVEFDIVDDNLVEETEEFKVAVVYSSVPAITWADPAPVNILDNDEVLIQFKKGTYDVNEDQQAVMEIEFTKGGVTSPVTITLASKPGTANAEDIITQTVDVTFQPGETGPKRVVFDIVDDPLVEAQENFYVSFASSTSPAVTFGEQAVINIRDNDEAVIGFSRSVYEVSEDENAVVDVQVTNGRIGVPVTVRMAATPLTARGQDFVQREFEVTFAAGETGPKSVEIDVIDDDSLENTEQFEVSLISSSVPAVKLGQSSSVNIVDNDEVVVGFTQVLYQAEEGEKATVQVQIASGQSNVPVTVLLQTSPVTAGPGDYSGEPIEITFQPGETGPKSIDIDTVDDNILEDTERFTTFLKPSTPGVKAGQPASVQILDNEVPPICDTPQDDCHRYATCADISPGEYSCKCNPGYTGDGKSCLAIDLCATGEHDCHGDATCISTGPGTYMCSCNEGFTGNGRTCEKLPPAAPVCKKMDIIFVLDRSASIRADDFEHMRDFLLRVGELLKIGKRDEEGDIIGQGSIITFSEEGTLRITLKESQTEGRFKSVVRSMPGPLQGGRTKTHRGLDVADKQAVTPKAGLRMTDDNVEKILMVITDGKQTKESIRRGYKYVGEAMRPFHNRSYLQVFAVGVGLTDDSAINEVKDMVEFPENAILTANYKELIDTVENIVMKFCPVPPICGSERDDCDKNLATCANLETGMYECTCNAGYIGNGKKCVAPYVCGTLRDDCHPYLASCTDTGNGNYNCRCIQNYVGDGKTCDATKICGTARDDCHEHATCTDTSPASYKCLCNKGYVGDGKMCEVEKICGTPKDDCHEFATCRDTGPGLHECTCKPGYTGDGKTCTALKLCGTPQDDCSEFATCTDTDPGKYTCTCKPGYTGDGKSCEAITICGTPQDDCSEFATCADTDPGRYSCTCNQGYTGNGKSCEAIRKCGTPHDDCSEFATCADTDPGKYTCTCNPGYTGDGKTCEAIRICGTPQDDCSEFATCADTDPGKYTCTCNPGYTGDGKTCEAIRICGTPQDDCSEFATCADTDPGKYTCTCNPGYTGDGKTCEAIIICGTPQDDCSEFATCADTDPGKYTCTCNPGYTGDGKTCEGVTVEFTKNTYSSTEGLPASPQIVVSAGSITQTTTVRVTASPGTAGNDDFSPKTIDVTFQPGEKGPKSITINIIDDDDVETAEEFTVSMSSSSPGVTLGEPATVVIQDNDNDKSIVGPEVAMFEFTKEAYTATEGVAAVPEIVVKAGDITEPTTIRVIASPSTAGNDDFSPKTIDVTFQPGEKGPKSIPINIIDDDDVETAEEFTVSMSSSAEVTLGGPATVVIQDNDKRVPCKPKTDLIFVLDRSGSIRAEDFNRMREFVKEIARELKVGERNDVGDIIGQAGIVTFSEEGEKRITLEQSQDKDKFYDVVTRMPGPLLQGRTKTHRGLALADKELAIKSAGYREDDPDVKKMIMVITDGQQTKESVRKGFVYVGDAMKPFFQKNMDVFAIGVGLNNEDAINEVKDMVQVPENAILAANYTDLLYRVESIIKKFCPAITVCGTPQDDCSEFATCTDTDPGKYTCTCKPGYTGDGKTCEAIRICGTPQHDCSEFATCVDTDPGKYTCTCNPGYTGDGKSCEVITICGTPQDDCSEFATCADTDPGKYTCTCNPGYTGDGKTCEVIRICGTPQDDCSEFATCADTDPGKYTCTCNPGYTGDGKTCEAIRICGTPRDDCSEFATCADTDPGKYTCTCKPGYTGDGKTCEVIRICGTPQDDCSEFATCADTDPGKYTCTCNPGYTGDGKTCEAIRICGTPRDDCSEFATCADTDPGKYTCTCKPGYTGDGKTCEAIRICGTPQDDCSEFATCADTDPGKYTCTCNPGYTGDGKSCEAITICGTPQDDCSEFATCADTDPGKYTCTCNPGYTGDGKTCEVIRICGTPQDNCSEFATCADTDPGKYTCTCNPGYTGDGKTCEAITICGTPQDDCSEFATCADTDPGKYTCTCNPGYTGDGKTCEVIRICGTPQDDCSEFATCADTDPGKYTCTCNPGYTGDGKTCEAIRICGTPRDDCSEFATCADTDPGKYTCTCNPGYTGDGKTCEAIRICGTPRDDCSEFATCADTDPGKYTCTCNPGYTGDGKTCEAIRICATPQDDCSEFATCADTDPGKYTCTCNPGYTGDGKSCEAITICGTPQDDCSEFATCADTDPGKYTCTCNPGYTGDGKTCEVIRICGTPQDDCSEFATCADTDPGKYTCTCNPGYTGDGKTCEVIRICGTPQDDCSEFATCADTDPGKYTCTCNPGYTGDGKTCEAIRICGTPRDDCSEFATCADTDPGKYTCTCNPGYTGDGKTCEAIRICATPQDDCSEFATCADTDPGKYTCTCNPGYTGDGKSCEAITICGTPQDDCSEFATCADTDPGKYTCTCNPGYTGDGKTCEVIRICGTPQDDCSEFATCADTDPGKYTCTCNPGYTGDGKTCEVIRICGTPQDDCSEFATCADTDPGKYTCTCNPGYTGDGKTCEVIRICGTPQDDCSEFATCADTDPGKYTCTCNPGYTGDGKTCEAIRICGTPRDDCSEFATCADTDPGKYTCTCKPGYTGDGKTCEAPCKPKTDLIFVLDRSGSIREEDFNRMREFVKEIARELKVGERNDDGDIIGQAGIVTFSEEGEKRITLAQSQDKDKFYDVVTRMPGPLPQGRTKTHRGLALADKELAIKSAGYREDDPDVKKMIMVITDGQQTKESARKGFVYVGDAMKPFFQRNMDVFAIGVGLNNEDAINEVKAMVQVPENAILAANYTDLLYRVESIIKKFCPETRICGTPQDDCNEFATCFDTGPGTFTCKCNKGYTGDGRTCNAIPICGTPQEDCSEFATCADTDPGKYTCTCNPGYTGDGKTCEALSICGTENDDCHKYAVCTNTGPGQYSCTCIQGYIGDGKSCEGPDIRGPILFELIPESPSTINAAWRPPPEKINSRDIIDYKVCYKDVSNGAQQCTTAKPTTPEGPVHFQFTDVNEDTTYEVVVQARNASGYGPPSNIMNVKTPVIEPSDACDKKTDTIFVVDRSSISESGFENIRSFILSVGKHLRIGVKNDRKEIIGQGAVVTFSDEGKKIVTLKDSRTPGRFAKAVRSMPGPLSDKSTRGGKIHRGLEVAYRQVAVVGEGLRARDDSVHKVIVVITYGHQTQEKNGYVYVGDAVKAFFKRGIDVIAVGVDLETQKAKDQLNDMVRIPENAFLVNHSSSNLSHAMKTIKSRVCPETKICGSPRDDCHRFATCFDTAPGEYKCICRDGYSGDGKECAEKRCDLDIGFLIDSSASMRDCNYEKEKKLVKHIAEQMQVGTNKSRASVILFSNTAAMYKKFNAFEELDEFNLLVGELPMVGGATHLDKALELAASQMFTVSNGMRDSTVPKLLFVLTDGAQAGRSMSKPLPEIVSSLHEKNIRVIVIGAGEADEEQLLQLVQANADLVMVQRFEDATNDLTTFSENMCSIGRCSHMERVVPVRIDGCVSRRPVKIGTCMGKCVTGPNFRLTGGIFKMDCQTCRPGRTVTKTVVLTCPGNRKRSIAIKEAASCVCEKCPWKKRRL